MGVITAIHPLRQAMDEAYELMDDSYKGSDAIKNRGKSYLRPTYSMVLDGFGSGELKCKGNVAYDIYKWRARYPEYVKEGINNMVGLMHSKPCTFELPASMQFLLTSASPFGEPLDFVLRRINFCQLKYGRLGILVDLPSVPSTNLKPYLAVYDGAQIYNWNDGVREENELDLGFVALRESSMKFNPETFEWESHNKSRVLQKIDGVYKQGVFEDDAEYSVDAMLTPVIRGVSLDQIPFVFCTDSDITTDVHTPPLKWLADMCIGIYNAEADYRQNLHMQGQDTLVVKNSIGDKTDDIRIGAGAVIYVDGQAGDAKFIGVSSDGLEQQYKAISDDKQEAAYRAGQFIGTKQAAQESGDAMQTRIAARTITLSDVADAGAAALQKALRIIAQWLNEDADKVFVKPNKDFAKKTISGQDLVQIVTARNLGAPISKESIHQYAAENGLTTLTFDQEMQLVKKEVPGEVPPLTEQTDTSTGRTNMANENTPSDQTPVEARTNVDSRP